MCKILKHSRGRNSPNHKSYYNNYPRLDYGLLYGIRGQMRIGAGTVYWI